MPLGYSDFLFFLFLVVLIVGFFAVFTFGMILKGERKPKKTSRENPKQKPPAPPQKKAKSDDPCARKTEGFYFGFLHKELDKRAPVPDECLQCDLKLECLQGKKPK